MEKAYETYKDSGVEWIGEIPEKWDVGRLYYYANSVGSGSTPKSDNSKYYNGNIGWLNTGDLTDGEVTNSKKFITQTALDDYSTLKIFPEGSIVIALYGATIGKLGIIKKEMTTNQACCVINPNEYLDSKYLFYYLLASRNYILSLAYGGGQPNISQDIIKKLWITTLTLSEQTQIAAYLDYHTGKIDQLIAKKESLIQKLQEQRQAIINEAVTKGLNPDLEMKDSGIEWLGEIPEHWDVNRIFGICDIVRGNTSFKKDELLNNGKYVALQYGKTYKVNEVDENYNFFVNDNFYKDSQVVNLGDTIIISTSETIEDLGHSVFYNRNDLGLLGGEQMMLKPRKKLDSKYLYYSTRVFLKELRGSATGVKVFRFNTDDLKNIYTCVPPLEEQKQIADYIDAKIHKISVSSEKLKTSIQKLKDYRQSFISEAVTGKINVRDWNKPK